MSRFSFVLLLAVGCADTTSLGALPPSDESTPCDSPQILPEGAFVARDAVTEADLPSCAVATHAIAGADASRLGVELTQWSGPGTAMVVVTDLLGNELASGAADEPGRVLDFALDRSGEYLVHLQADDHAGAEYALTSVCTTGCDRPYTRWPVLLMHGIAGADAVLGIVDYWGDVDHQLEDRGWLPLVRATDPFQSSAVRAEGWREHLEQLVDEGLARRFNLLGHSQGGIDARYLTARLDPEGRVASVTTISSPHLGTPAAAIADTTLLDGAVTQAMLDAASNALGTLYGLSDPQDLDESLRAMSPGAMEAFNLEILDRDDVYYQSWAGETCRAVDLACVARLDGEVVTPLLNAPHLLVTLASGPNDALVPIPSAQWGDYRGVIPVDHLNQVGMGIAPWSYSATEFFHDEFTRLAALGY